jgi:carbon monoxide dehydrogenase subunit G
MRSEERATFAARPERVWDVLADWRRYPEWMPDVAWVRAAGPDREAGLVLLVRTKVFGIPAATDVVQVTRWEPPRLLAVRHGGIVRGPAEWVLQPEETGTRFTWREDLTMAPPVAGEIALRLYWPWQRRMFRRSIENLRRLVDGP